MERLRSLHEHGYYHNRRFLLIYYGWLLARLDYHRLRMALVHNDSVGLNITIFTFGVILFAYGMFCLQTIDSREKIIAYVCCGVHPIAVVFFICEFVDGFKIANNYDWFKLSLFIFNLIIIAVAVGCSIKNLFLVTKNIRRNFEIFFNYLLF